MDSRTSWKTAFRLSWPSFWLTLLYGAIVLPPFAILIMFSGEANLPFSFVLFFTVMGTLLWKSVGSYIDDGLRLAPDVFAHGIIPVVLGKEPTPAQLKNGRARRRTIREMVRERFTAFSFAALLGSVIVGATKQPLMAFLYLPLWMFMDVCFFRQMLLHKGEKNAVPEISAEKLKTFMTFDRWKDGGWQRPFKIAVLWPALLLAVLWFVYPLTGGAITLSQDPEITAFFATEKPVEADKNGIYAILGLASKEEDLHKAGQAAAAQLLKGESPAMLVAEFPDGPTPVCRTDTAPPEGQTCIPLLKTQKLLAANTALLDRYEQLYRYETFVWPRNLVAAGMTYEEAYLSGLTDLGLLKVISYLHLAATGSPEKALKEWLYHTAFLAKLMKAQDSLHAYANARHVYGEAMAALPYILGKDPSLAKKYHDGIRKSFAYLGPRDIEMVDIIRNEARLTSWSADKQIEAAFSQVKALDPENASPLVKRGVAIAFNGSAKVLDSKLYWLTREMEQLAREDRDDMKTVHDRLEGIQGRYTTRNGRLLHGIADLAMPHISAVVNLLLSPLPEYYGRILFDTADYNRQRMLLAHVESLNRGIKPEGMEGFLKTNAKEIEPQLVELATGEPFYWDKDKQKICYDENPPPETQKPKLTHCLETSSLVE